MLLCDLKLQPVGVCVRPEIRVRRDRIAVAALRFADAPIHRDAVTYVAGHDIAYSPTMRDMP